jgi:dienelactone hydrolase
MKELIKKILREQTMNTVLVIFGGIDYATPEWMNEQIPNHIKDNKTIIVKSYNSNIEEVIEELNELNYDNLEVVGFSAGGRNVFKLVKKIKIDLVGLIDPTVPRSWSLEGFPQTSILFFNNDNWAYYPDIKERQLELKDSMVDKGMIVVEEELNHKDFPKVFFTEYIN